MDKSLEAELTKPTVNSITTVPCCTYKLLLVSIFIGLKVNALQCCVCVCCYCLVSCTDSTDKSFFLRPNPSSIRGELDGGKDETLVLHTATSP